MNTKGEEAKKCFECGYNCSQAVFCTFCKELGIDKETALKIASSFGGGMGRMREVCGAVTGMFMAAGLKYGYTLPENPSEKTEHYKKIQILAERFKERNGSIICRELLEKAKVTHSNKKSCGELVKDAAEIFDEFIKENG